MRTVRQARQEDLGRVMAIVRAAGRHLADLGVDQWDDLYPSEAILRADIERQQLWVVEDDLPRRVPIRAAAADDRPRRVPIRAAAADGRALAGLVALDETESPEYAAVAWRYGGRVLVVHRLAVDPARQGRGCAAALMAFAERHAAASGYDAIRLDVFTRNPAATALYEHRGYRRAGTVRFRKGEFLCYEKRVRTRGGSRR